MNIQEMLSKMNSQMLMQGLKQISQGLTPEQLKNAEAAIKSAGLSQELGNVDINSLQKTLQSNPDMLKNLVQDKALMEKLEKIVKNK